MLEDERCLCAHGVQVCQERPPPLEGRLNENWVLVEENLDGLNFDDLKDYEDQQLDLLPQPT